MGLVTIYTKNIAASLTSLERLIKVSRETRFQVLEVSHEKASLALSYRGIVTAMIVIINNSERPTYCPSSYAELVVPLVVDNMSKGVESVYKWILEDNAVLLEEFRGKLLSIRSPPLNIEIIVLFIETSSIPTHSSHLAILEAITSITSSWKLDKFRKYTPPVNNETIFTTNDDVKQNVSEPIETSSEKSSSKERSSGSAIIEKKSEYDISNRGSYNDKVPLNVWNPALGRRIRQLYPSLLHLGEYRPITANTPSPVAFQTDLFQGKALLMLHTKPMDKLYAARLEGTKYTFEVQVQGKFTTIPTGPLFFGAEITKKMELGLFTRGMCGTLLQLVRSVAPSIHHSFGDAQGLERPHITIPVWSAVDRLVISRPGEELPEFGQIFQEPLEKRNQRRSIPNFEVDVDLDCTYSFSFKTSNFDLLEWKIINIPVMKSMDLHNFWNDADLRFIAYCLPKSLPLSSGILSKHHFIADMNVFFSLEIKHHSNHPELSEPVGLDDIQADLLSVNLPSTETVNRKNEDYEDEMDGDEDSVNDGSEVGVALESESEDSSISDLNDDSRYYDVDRMSSVEKNSKPSLSVIQPSLQYDAQTYLLNMDKISYDLVFAVVEIDDYRRANARRTCYAFLADPWGAMKNPEKVKVCIIRTYKEWAACLPIRKCDPRPLNYNRLSEVEQRRIDLNNSYLLLMKSCTGSDVQKSTVLSEKLKLFLNPAPHTNNFLRSSNSITFFSPNSGATAISSFQSSSIAGASIDSGKQTSWISSPKLRSGLSTFLMESLVCVQEGNTIWSEECMGLTKQELVFIKPSYRVIAGRSRKSRLIIPLSTIMSIQEVAEQDCVFIIENTCYLLVSTFSKQYMIMFRGEDIRSRWFAVLKLCMAESLKVDGLPTNLFDQSSSSNSLLFGIFIGRKHHMSLVGRSKTWSSGDREILNLRTFTTYFLRLATRSPPLTPITHLTSKFSLSALTDPPKIVSTDELYFPSSGFVWTKWLDYLDKPNIFVEKLLQKIFNICKWMRNPPSLHLSTDTSVSQTSLIDNDLTGMSKSNESDSNLEDLPPILASHWIDFLDGVSLLQSINLSNTASVLSIFEQSNGQTDSDVVYDENLCLLLNLYHIMLIHGFLVMGVPDCAAKWSGFFGTVAYEAFGDVFTLAELEHCVIRYGLHRPNINLIAARYIPSARYSFSLPMRRKIDHRLLWALNCGSESLASFVPIYRASVLDSQLDVVTSLALAKQLTIRDGTIYLPQACQWYLKDFEGAVEGIQLSTSSNTSLRAVAGVLQKYLTKEKEADLVSLLSQSSGQKGHKAVKFAFSQFSFRCRFLECLGGLEEGV